MERDEENGTKTQTEANREVKRTNKQICDPKDQTHEKMTTPAYI